MAKVALSRISPELAHAQNWRRYLGLDIIPGEENFYFGADAFHDSDHNLFGVAYSQHSYDWYSLGQRDVQLAFETIQHTINTDKFVDQRDARTLQKLLQRVTQSFAALNVPPEDDHATPWVRIALVRLHGTRLSSVSIGDVNIRVIHSDGSNQVLQGSKLLTDDSKYQMSLTLTTDFDPSWVNLYEIMTNPGDLIVVATSSMEEVIAEADLSNFSGLDTCDPEAASQHLIDVLKSQPGNINDPPGTPRPGRLTDYDIRGCGAAWAIACVESTE
jgi:hypothetical protein